MRSPANVPHDVFRRGQRGPGVSIGIGVEELGMAIEWDPQNFDVSTDIIGIPGEEQVEIGPSPRRTGAFP